MEQPTENNPCVLRHSTIGEEKQAYYQYANPEKCQNVDPVTGLGCQKFEHILYPYNGKKYCLFCWAKLKYYSDKLGFEKGKQVVIGKNVVKKNAFYSKAEKLFEEKKIEEIEWNDFKTLYISNKKKARRYIKKVFKTHGL